MVKLILYCLLVVCLTADTAVNLCYGNNILYFSTDCTKTTNSVIFDSKAIAFAMTDKTGNSPTASNIKASQLSGQLDLSKVSIPASKLSGSPIPASRIDQNGTLSSKVLPRIPTSLLAANLQSIPFGFDGSYASLTQKPTLFSGDYTNLSNKPNFELVLQGFFYVIYVLAIIALFICLWKKKSARIQYGNNSASNVKFNSEL